MPRKSIQKTKKRKTNRKQTRRQRGGSKVTTDQRGGAGFSESSIATKRLRENSSTLPSNRTTRSKYTTMRSNEAAPAVARISDSNKDTNTCTEEAKALLQYTNIYNLLGKTLVQKKMILNCFREALQERITQGKQNWLVFLAKYGTPSEQERFVSPNWVFSDITSDGHPQNVDYRLLLQMDMTKEEDIKLLFDKCEGLFHYITFDGSLAGTNITAETVDSFVKGLTPDGILAAEYKNSNIRSDGSDYETGIFHYPLGVVPLGGWLNSSDDLQNFKLLVWLMFLAEEIGIPFSPLLNRVAYEIGYNDLIYECRGTYTAPPGGNVPEECKPGLEQIQNALSVMNEIKTSKGKIIWPIEKKRLIKYIASQWQMPYTIFNGLQERLTEEQIGNPNNVIVAIRKKEADENEV